MEKHSIMIDNIEYKIIKELGKGTFSKVYQVLNKSDNKYYAIKEIPIKNEAENIINNLQNEAVILSKFNSNNIVKFYGISKDNNNIYILMKFCSGGNLKNFIDEHINNNTLIEENIIKNIIKQICMGIKEIHDKSILHRDLKPEKIFMNDNMNIKIGGFSTSKQLNSNESHRTSINGKGTYFYMAPELLIKGIYNEKSDMWSLGCIIYELFNLNIYYNDKSFDEVKEINSDIYNNKWQKLIDSLLEPDYKKRIDINHVIMLLEEL